MVENHAGDPTKQFEWPFTQTVLWDHGIHKVGAAPTVPPESDEKLERGDMLSITQASYHRSRTAKALNNNMNVMWF